jgi:hypothetical protein
MSTRWSNISHGVTIRWALPADLSALERLAALDSKQLPAGPLLVAEVGEELWAAFSVLDGIAVADPFRPSADLVGLLSQRAAQIREVRPPSRVLRLEPLLARLR